MERDLTGTGASRPRGLGVRVRVALAAAASAIALGMATPTLANYDVGLQAYKEGQIDLAIEIWERFALAGDVPSRKVLGDVYSGMTLEVGRDVAVPLESIPVDNVRALTWYTLAAFHEFSQYESPTPRDVNSRILAQQRLGEIRFRMSSSEVRQAETRISETYESGTPYDLYRLGVMYQKGSGLEKDNVKAFQFYSLAKDRGVKEAAEAYRQLEPLMTKVEQKRAEDMIAVWQPPLPPEHQGKTPQQVEIEKLKKELEEVKLAEALEATKDIDTQLVQRSLNALGFRAGEADGALGQQTRDAIRRYQRSLAAKDPLMTAEERDRTVTGELTPRQTVRLIGDAAAKGHPYSEYIYGVMHITGIGVEKDGAQAVKWLSRAADQNFAIAHYALGVIYRDSTTGLNEVQTDQKLAAYHFAQAVALGYGPAQNDLERLKFDSGRDAD